ncbi:MAG: hypothetical protein ACLQUY_11625 [Ktedonobacterales bacterium]
MTNSGASSSGSAGADEARDDLMATLAAARELNPDMDKALADQYLARRKEEQQRVAERSPVVADQPERSAAGRRGRPRIPLFAMVPLLALILVAALTTHGDFLFFLWIPLMFGGLWWRRGWAYSDSSDDPHYQRRMARERFREERLAARYGYSPRPEGGNTSERPQLPDQAPVHPLPGPQKPAVLSSPEAQSAAGPFAGGAPPANPAG